VTAVTAAVLFAGRWKAACRELRSRDFAAFDRLLALEKQLEECQMLASLGEKLVGIAHSWKNAVHNLRGFAALLEPKIMDRPGALEVLRGQKVAIDQLEETARETLDPPLGQRKSGGTRSLLRSSDTARTIEAVAKEVVGSFPGIRLRQHHEGEIPPVLVPRTVLREVLVNLLLNAAEAMFGSGVITLRTFANPGVLTIEVCDDGHGIPQADINKLFRPGYTTKPQGSGLGLFLARQLLRSHGGNLVVKPVWEGGASFVITVPAGKVTVPREKELVHEEPCADSR
jgi:signal transduction histidine kinase